MNYVQENKVSMYFKIRTFYANQLATLQVNAPILTTQVGSFNTLLTALGQFDMEAVENNQGYAVQKQAFRIALRDAAIGVAGSLHSMASDTANTILAGKTYTTKSTLDAKRDTDILYWCERLLVHATANTAAIIPYGTSAAKITAFTTSITKFKNAIQNPADQRSESVAAGIEVDKKIVEIDAKLRTIDSTMDAIAQDFPLLYNQYQADRRIDDNNNNATTPDVTEVIEQSNLEVIYTVPYLASRSFKLKNTGNLPVEWGLSNDATLFTNSSVPLAANTSSNLLSSTLAPSGDFLLVKNSNATSITVELTITE